MTAAGTGEVPVGLASTFLGAAVPVVLFLSTGVLGAGVVVAVGRSAEQ